MRLTRSVERLALGQKHGARGHQPNQPLSPFSDLVEEAQNAIGVKEARRALLKAKIERGDA